MPRLRARISATTHQKLDDFARGRGLRKNDVLEQALLSFIESRTEFPEESFVPTTIVLGNAAFDKLVKALKRPPIPTRALVELMRGK